VDHGAVKVAATSELVRCAVGAAANAQGLLDDAELLSAAERHARAYALAALAVEEVGKAASLGALAMMPANLRAQAPVGRMLEWHQLKLIGGMLIAAMPPGTFCVAGELATMPPGQVAGILDNARALAEDHDRLKRRGLYADMDRSGQVRLPSEVTDADVAAQFGPARRAVSSARTLLDHAALDFLAHPPAEATRLCGALLSAFAEAGYGRTPQAAADVWRDAIRKLRMRTAASDTRTQSGRAGLGK